MPITSTNLKLVFLLVAFVSYHLSLTSPTPPVSPNERLKVKTSGILEKLLESRSTLLIKSHKVCAFEIVDHLL